CRYGADSRPGTRDMARDRGSGSPSRRPTRGTQGNGRTTPGAAPDGRLIIDLTVEQIAADTDGRVASPVGTAAVPGEVVTDSRHAGPGDLFVALPGARVDGHEYLQAAADAGAVAALVSREVAGAPLVQIVVADTAAALGALAQAVLSTLRDTSEPPQVVAITGSVGKTSTKDLLAAAVES